MSISALTQAEAVTEVANIIGREKTSLSADQSTTYEDRIKQWLYWSHLTIARMYAFPELDQDPVSYTLNTSTNIYTFANIGLSSSRVRQILGITVVDSTRSKKIPQKLWRQFQEDFPYPSAQAARKPECYTIYGKRVEFDRLPDSTYTISVRANYLPSNYSSSSAASVYENKDDLIIAGAVTHAYISLQENEDAKHWAGVFTDRFRAVIGPELDPGDWEPEGRAFDFVTQGRSIDAHMDPFQLSN